MDSHPPCSLPRRVAIPDLAGDVAAAHGAEAAAVGAAGAVVAEHDVLVGAELPLTRWSGGERGGQHRALGFASGPQQVRLRQRLAVEAYFAGNDLHPFV